MQDPRFTATSLKYVEKHGNVSTVMHRSSSGRRYHVTGTYHSYGHTSHHSLSPEFAGDGATLMSPNKGGTAICGSYRAYCFNAAVWFEATTQVINQECMYVHTCMCGNLRNFAHVSSKHRATANIIG